MEKHRLKEELRAILKSDQELRELFISKTTAERKKQILNNYAISNEEFQELGWAITLKNDSINLAKIEKIIKKYGYPKRSIVGDSLHTATWYVIQHSKLPIIEEYFPLIEKANKNGDLEDAYVALMKDRMLMYQQKEQIYGSQVAGRLFVNADTGKEEWTNFIWPVADWNQVNQLRKSAGITHTIEEYAQSMGLKELKKYTITEIQEKTKK